MLWPLEPGPMLLVVAATAAVSLLWARHVRRLAALSTGAARTGNADIIAATQRRVARSWERQRNYVLPTLCLGMALMLAHAVACLAVVLPH